MTNYESPVILRTEELAEGVYLASGCYTASAYIHQTPQSGSGEYRIQVNGQHSADHTKEAQTLTISFSLHQFRRITGIRQRNEYTCDQL